VPGIVGLAKPVRLPRKKWQGSERLTSLRERLKKKINDQLEEVYVNVIRRSGFRAI